AGAAAAAAAAPVVATNHGNPVVASVRAPQYTVQGRYAWPVSMTTGAALATRSWIIQHVIATGDGLNVDLYEAFEVAPGATTSAEDIFQDDPRADDGSVRVVGRFQHISYSDAADRPPGMEPGAVGGSDDSQPTSASAPPGWVAGAGTRHELDFAWDDSRNPPATRFTTEPNGGTAEHKANPADLRSG
ncbi:MAG: hypothetical protein JWN67_525, partial [Actinomycetia bacterium]|nr:hypothetical protein [Actinomycetes bacterium]